MIGHNMNTIYHKLLLKIKRKWFKIKLKKKLISFILLISVLTLSLTNSNYIIKETSSETKLLKATKTTDDTTKEPSQLYAQAACLMDVESGRILFEKNGEKVLPMASTTKIMTLIILLENANLDDIVTVSSYAARQPDVQLNINTGEQYYLKDLIYSLMLESHNDSAVALAEHLGSVSLGKSITKETTSEESKKYVEEFAKQMNQKALDLKCENTYFITPNGLDATTTENNVKKTHSTTAEELCKIASYAIKNEQFIEIINTRSHSFSEVSKKRSFTVNNKDRFLDIYDGAIGVKTGFTSQAGYCFVGAVKKGNKTFVSAVLGSGWPPNKNYKWSDTTKLMNYGMDNYEYYSFNEMGIDENKLLPIPVEGGKTQQMDETAKIHYEIVENIDSSDPNQDQLKGMLMKNSDKVEVICEIPTKLEAPVQKGTTIGKVSYLVEGIEWRVDSVVTTETIEKIDFQWCLEQVLSLFLF